MIKILEELQEMVMKWGDHASNYFQEKDDLASDYAKISKYIQDQKRREHIDSVLSDEEKASDLIPMNWLDPLLTGKENVMGEPPFNCNDVEALLRAIKKKIIEFES